MNRWVKMALAVGLLGATAACVTTKADGDQMRSDLDALTQKFNAREQEWEAASKSYSDEVQKLHDTLKEASDLMARNSANVGQQVQDLQVALSQMQGSVDEMTQVVAKVQKDFDDYRHQNDTSVQTLTKIVMTPPASSPVMTADSLFDQAYKESSSKSYDDARKDFRAFLLKFPFDPRAANAQFWIADAFFQQANYASAIPEYQKVLDNYPSSELADQAMYQEAESFYSVKWCGPALAYLKDLPKKYPATTMAADVKTLTATVLKAQKTKDACTK